MRKNEILTLTADNLGAEMEGVCRHEGMAVFVPGLLPGEEAPVRIVKAEKRYAFGRLEAPPADPSPERRVPDCTAFPRCGGCSCRHMNYEATLEAKRRQVQDCFSRIGRISLEVPPVLGMDSPFAYRNKTSLPIGGTAGDPVPGFFSPRSHTIIPTLSCPNAMAPTNEIALAFRDWMKKYRIAPYREETHTGLIRHLVVRVNREHRAMVTVVLNGRSLENLPPLRQALEPLGVDSLYLNYNQEKTNVIFSRHFQLIYGNPTLSDTLCGLRFELSPASFFQINPFQTEVLYQTAVDFAGLSSSESLCDVYCGAGTITLTMARHCKKATGIEIVPAAIDNARENAERNGITNVDFHTGSAEELLPRMVREGLRPDVIVVDPPRKGLEKAVIDAMAEAAPSRLVYVSCNPATQARDAALLLEKGYEIQRIQPVDMFPFTSHVETVCLLSKLSETKNHISVKVDMDEMDVTAAESKATYQEIQDWVQEKYGFHVTNLNIAQVKQKHGIIERENYNKPKSEDSRQPGCPEEKAKAIEEAMKYFQMI